MNKTVVQRVNALETYLQTCEQPFYLLCKEWANHPEKRTQIATEAELSETAASYIFTTGLKYGRPENEDFPFSSWTMPELQKAIHMIGE